MDVSRLRLGSAIEWAVAVVFLAATIAVGSLILRQLGMLGAPAPAGVVEPAPPTLPTAIPPLAISVPALSLADGTEVRLGDTLEQVTKAVGPDEVEPPVVDRGRLGARVTRFYKRAQTRFLVVFEPFERQGELRAAAIYIQ